MNSEIVGLFRNKKAQFIFWAPSFRKSPPPQQSEWFCAVESLQEYT